MQPRDHLNRNMKLKNVEKFLEDEFSEMNLIDVAPISFLNYFSNEIFLSTEIGNFRLLKCGEKGPLCLLIHGAGYSSTTWCLFCREILKFTELRLVALDLRGHGLTETSDNSLLSKNQLLNDIILVIENILTPDDRSEGVIIIGHSLGGALAIWMAEKELNFKIRCLIVIDVDEEGALNTEAMLRSIEARPEYFTSISSGIKYSYFNRKIKNLEADQVSFPGQLVEASRCQNKEFSPGVYLWRVDLFSTKCFWHDWFFGVSKKFVSLSIPRMIILSDKDRIDKNILIGQMQGLFRVEPLERCGHTVHEDDPVKISKCIVNYLRMQRIIG